jgi:ankyrin repeat protein
MKLLIAAQADVNCIGCGIKPLHAATFTGNIPAAKLLIDAKADVKSVEGFESSLFIAVRLGFVELSKFYISAGADVNMRTQKNETCADTLIRECRKNMTWTRDQFVIDHAPIIADIFNKTPCDYPSVFRVLIDAKADIYGREAGEESLLHVAARVSNFQAVKILLAAGSNVNDTNDLGKTPLMYASITGCLDAVNALIAAGANVNHVCCEGATALAGAALNDHLDVVSALIAAGVNVNYVLKHDMTIINMLEHRDFPRIVDILEKAGAVTAYEVLRRTSGLVRAINYNNIMLVSVLVQVADAKEKEMALIVAVGENMHPIVRCLLAGGADPSTTYRGQSMLIWASLYGFTAIVKELIDAGADITEKDLQGKTALQIAAKRKHRDVVALLLAKAAVLKNANK